MKKPSKRRRKVRLSAVKVAAAAMMCALVLASAATRASSTSSTTSSTPDVKTLVLKFAHAMHYDKLSKLRTRTTTASGFIDNHVVTYTTMAKAPDKMLEIITVDGTDVRESIGYDGTTAWAQLPSGAVVTFGDAARRWIAGVASGLGGDPRTVSGSSGTTTIDGVEYYAIRIRDAEGYGRDIILDEKTYLPIYGRIVAGSATHLYDVGPLDAGPLGELYPRIAQIVNIDGTLGNPASVTSVDDNITLPDSMFSPPTQ